MNRLTQALLGIIAIALVAIAVVLIVDRTGGPEQDAELDRARAYFRDGAELYCTMNGAASSAADLYSPEYKTCVKDTVAARVERWEDLGRPSPSSLR